jgi:hypothetical protein
MRPSYRSILLGVGLTVLGATPNVAQQACKPALTVTAARISEPRNLQRTWSAALAVDASHCATTSGQFDIVFTRLKDSTPDLQFIERFTWAPGQTAVSLDIWWDEWVQDYRLGRVAPCPCRE